MKHFLAVCYQGPFRSKRTRKSSVPDRAQWFNDKSHGFSPTLKWFTAWAVKRLKTSWVERIANQISWFYQPLVRLTAPASF